MAKPRHSLFVGLAALAALPLIGTVLALFSSPGLIAAAPLDPEQVWVVARRSILMALAVGAFSTGLGAWFAWADRRWVYPGGTLLGRAVVLPIAIPSFLIAATLRYSLAPAGELGEVLGLTGRFEGFWPSVCVLTLCCVPYVHLAVASALDGLSFEQEEAARSLGASRLRVVRAVLFPALRPALGFSLVLVLIYALADFGAVAVLGNRVLTWELYLAAERGGPQAAVLGAVLVAVVVPMIALGRLLKGRLGAGALAQQEVRTAPRVRPSVVARNAVMVAQLLVVGLGVAVPVLSAIHWSLRGGFAGQLLAPLLNTLGLAVLGGLLTVVLAGCLADAAARGRRGLQRASDYLAFGVSALPGVLVAYGFLQLGFRLSADAYRAFEAAGVVLLLALALRFLAQAYAPLRAGLLAENREALEAAELLGQPRWRRIWRVRLPGLAPSLAAGFLLSFVAIIKELPITLMLLPAGKSTLATVILDAHEDAHLADLGAAALALLGCVLAARLLLGRWSRHG
jgi:iron(III) transport system permease protein